MSAFSGIFVCTTSIDVSVIVLTPRLVRRRSTAAIPACPPCSREPAAGVAVR